MQATAVAAVAALAAVGAASLQSALRGFCKPQVKAF
jgi:hypothetical protein